MGLFNYPLFRLLSTTKDLDKYFSPSKRKEFIEQYLQSIHLSQGVSGTESFNTYQKTRDKGLTDLLKFQVDTGKKDDKKQPITAPALGDNWKRLQESNHANTPDVKNAIKTALQDTPTLTTALERFNNDMEMLNQRLKNPPVTGTPQEIQEYNKLIKNLPGILHASKVEAMDAIKAHQAEAKQNLMDLKTDVNFRTHLQNVMGLTGDDEIDNAIDELIDASDKSHAAKLKEFESGVNDSISMTHQAIQREHDRIAYIGAMRTLNNKEFQKAIDELATQNLKKMGIKQPGVIMSSNPDTGSVNLKNMRVEDLSVLKTITGRDIVKAPDGSFNVQLPKFGFIYYNSRHQQVDYDLQSLAEAVRACGHDTVTINVNYEKDPLEAEEYARKMYEACINAGFEPDKISIKVNGADRKLTSSSHKEGEPGGLFDKDPTRLQRTERIAKNLKAEREESAKAPATTDLAKYKKELNTLRETPIPDIPEPDAQPQHTPP